MEERGYQSAYIGLQASIPTVRGGEKDRERGIGELVGGRGGAEEEKETKGERWRVKRKER